MSVGAKMGLDEVGSNPAIGMLIVVAIFIVILCVFGYFIKKKNTILESERNLTPIYTENCGARFGALNLTFPFFDWLYTMTFLF
jgi:hypothetical protein